ncbi:MAG: ATP-binding protein [Candidatus Nanohaloarchaea archaeon]|nr:ATP-binding protein [Candidatus Nanohaloarchaea archaeon]
MYEKKLREIFKENKNKAEAALDQGDKAAAASYYENCGDILMEEAKNKTGPAKKEKKNLAEKYYEISKNLAGRSDSLKEKYNGGGSGGDGKSGSGSSEDDDFAEYVQRFIQESNTTWNDVAGLQETKKNLRESFALSAIENKPAAIESIHSILLYGPPGTGKTLLASAVAGSHDYPFFNVKLSHALSKYYGESGKIISQLFSAAREKAPAIVFFDELDSIAMSRGGDMDEATRRVLSTLLTELSGFDKENSDIMFVGATNTPWDLDPAILSRIERVIYVPLPDETTARKIIELNTVEEGLEMDCNVEDVARQCVDRNYSGREIKNVTKEAVRHMVDAMNPELENLADQPVDDVRDYQLNLRGLTFDDFKHAFQQIDPKTDPQMVQRYREWGEQFGG